MQDGMNIVMTSCMCVSIINITSRRPCQLQTVDHMQTQHSHDHILCVSIYCAYCVDMLLHNNDMCICRSNIPCTTGNIYNITGLGKGSQTISSSLFSFLLLPAFPHSGTSHSPLPLSSSGLVQRYCVYKYIYTCTC